MLLVWKGIKMELSREGVIYNCQAETQKDLFNFVEDKAIELGCSKTGLSVALSNREREYPTGLDFGELHVAMAHTSPEFSLSDFVFVIKPQSSIQFRNIEDFKPIEVDLIFVLLLKTGEYHTKFLSTLVTTFQNSNAREEIKIAQNAEELYTSLCKYFN